MRKVTIIISLVLVFISQQVVLGSNIFTMINELETSGKKSNDLLDQAIIDFSNVSNGTVTASVYSDVYEDKTVETFDITPTNYDDATNKFTRFTFELTNRYRPETNIALKTYEDMTVSAFVYGTQQDRVMSALVYGIPDVLYEEPYTRDTGGGGSSWVDRYDPAEEVTENTNDLSVFATTFSVDEPVYTVNTTSYTMDVAPEIQEERVFTPIRYVAYSLDVNEDNLEWDNDAKTATIKKDDTIISLTVGSKSIVVNREPVEMDVSPYIKDGRTMLPSRYVAESLGAEVEYDGKTRTVTIKIPNKAERGE